MPAGTAVQVSEKGEVVVVAMAVLSWLKVTEVTAPALSVAVAASVMVAGSVKVVPAPGVVRATVTVPTEPGLGYRINWDYIQEHRIDAG